MSSTSKYEVGDIVLADNSIIKPQDLTEIADSNFPIAVVADLKDNGDALGVGVHRSDAPLKWANEDTVGYVTKFEDIVCTKAAADFDGDTDGSDNWKMICSAAAQDTGNEEENYPAFNFINTYAQVHQITGDCAYGWYMPSIAELYSIYENRDIINNSLQKIYSLNNNAAMDGLSTTWYWSSSQADSADDYAWFIHYFNGYAGECPKNFTNVNVLAVRIFKEGGI